MAQGYKSDASHCANPDIGGEDVPSSIRSLVSDILKAGIFVPKRRACRLRFPAFLIQLNCQGRNFPSTAIRAEETLCSHCLTHVRLVQVYSTKDEAEQASIVNNHYSEEAHFVDP